MERHDGKREIAYRFAVYEHKDSRYPRFEALCLDTINFYVNCEREEEIRPFAIDVVEAVHADTDNINPEPFKADVSKAVMMFTLYFDTLTKKVVRVDADSIQAPEGVRV